MSRAISRPWAKVAVSAIFAWFFFTVLPVVLLRPRGLDGVVAKQWGEPAQVYLSTAPVPLVLHLILTRWVAWFTLPILAFSKPERRWREGEAADWRGALVEVVAHTLVLCAVWLLGVGAAWAVALVRGAPPDVAGSFATQLGGFGLLTLLPLWAAVYVIGQLVPKRSLAMLVLALGALSWALLERVLERSSSTVPLPGLLLRRLLSGDAEQVQQALASSLYVAGAALAIAVAARVLVGRRMHRARDGVAISSLPL